MFHTYSGSWERSSDMNSTVLWFSSSSWERPPQKKIHFYRSLSPNASKGLVSNSRVGADLFFVGIVEQEPRVGAHVER